MIKQLPSCRCSRLAVVAVTLAMQAVVAAIGVSPAYAESYIVTSLADTDVSDGACTLREAIRAANNTPFNADCGPGSPAFDIIFIVVGGTIVLNGELPVITQNVIIQGQLVTGTTIDANGRGRAFFIGGPVDVTLEKLTITNGKAPDGFRVFGSLAQGLPGENGGAIWNRGRLHLRDVRITHSTAGRGAPEAGGSNRGGVGGAGGAIYNDGTIVGYRVTFDENRAGEGGAPLFDNPRAAGGFGGAIFNDLNGFITLYAATFAGNAQGWSGSGAAVFNRGAFIIKSSTFVRNGIPGEVPQTASLVTDFGAMVLSSTIMADFPACLELGSGLIQDAGFNLGGEGLIQDPGFNLGGPVTQCHFTPAAGSIVDSSGLPLVNSELRQNGGFVPTFALPATHLAVNRVPASFEDCDDPTGKLTILGLPADLTDARGVARPQNGSCDIGAYEVGPSFRLALRTLAITGGGTGQGTVTGGGGLECAIAAGATSGQCSSEYDRGTVVTATPTAAAGSIFVGWDGDPECADGSVVMDGDKHCTAIFDLRGFSVRGSANGVGDVHPAKRHGSGDVTFDAKFVFAGAIDLASATMTINALLNEEGASGAGELVEGVPIVLPAVPGGGSTAAIFETPSDVAPRATVQVQIGQSSPSAVAVAIADATIARFPQLCAPAKSPAITLTTRFTIDDGVHPPLTVTAREPWRCLAPISGDKHQPRLLRTQ